MWKNISCSKIKKNRFKFSSIKFKCHCCKVVVVDDQLNDDVKVLDSFEVIINRDSSRTSPDLDGFGNDSQFQEIDISEITDAGDGDRHDKCERIFCDASGTVNVRRAAQRTYIF